MRSFFRKAAFREMLLASGVVFCVGFAWLSTSEIAPNERARVYLSLALVERGEVQVDPEVQKYGKNWDLSRRDGHYYCNKPPGSSLLGAAVYQVAHSLTGGGDWSMPGLFHLMRFGVMLPLALLGFLAIRRWMRLLGLSEVTVDVASVGWMLGSAAFHYAGAFFSHHIIAVFLVTALWLLEWARQSLRGGLPGEGRPEPLDWRHAAAAALAGFSLGIVGLTEYQAGVSCLFVALWALGTRELRRIRILLPFGAAAATCVGILLWYNTVAFGGPLEFSYEYHVSGGGGEPLSYPQLKYLAGLLFSLHRGLFTNAPWLMLMIPGVFYLADRRDQTGMAILLTAIVLFRIGLLSGYKWWSGDWGFGPRHLVASMGVMAVLSAVTLERLRASPVGAAFGRGLVFAGIAYNQIQDAFLAEMPLGARNPVLDIAVPFFRGDTPSPNLVSAIWGLEGVESLIPLAVVAGALGVFVLVRGVSATRGFVRRVAVVLMSLLPAVALGLHVYARGPSWKKPAREDFRKMMQKKFDADLEWHRRDD